MKFGINMFLSEFNRNPFLINSAEIKNVNITKRRLFCNIHHKTNSATGNTGFVPMVSPRRFIHKVGQPCSKLNIVRLVWTTLFQLKEFRVRIFQSIVFCFFLLQSDSEFASEMQKEFGVTDFVSEHDEVCGKLLWFRQISAQGFIV